MVEIGPYRFSEMDARATLAHAADLFDVLVADLPPATAAMIEPRRATALAALDGPPGDALAAYWAELRAAAHDLRAARAYGGTASGRAVQLNTSGGGVPKLPVERVEVGWRGVSGDRQASRRHHGRPWQALCLWSAEVIDDLAAAGHPIGYGAAGENVTVAGLDWARMRPGVELALGTVRAEVTSFAIPCAQNARWFSDRKSNRIHHRHGPVSRVYALVTHPGSITTHDEVVLLPAPKRSAEPEARTGGSADPVDRSASANAARRVRSARQVKEAPKGPTEHGRREPAAVPTGRASA